MDSVRVLVCVFVKCAGFPLVGLQPGGHAFKRASAVVLREDSAFPYGHLVKYSVFSGSGQGHRALKRL